MQKRILEWILRNNGKVYVSFSGGKDSTVLADLTARVYRMLKQTGYNGDLTLVLVFIDTGLEYPEIKQFVKVFAEWIKQTYEIDVELQIIRPEMTFNNVVEKYGYPIISKEVADTICGARKSLEKDIVNSRLKKVRGELVKNNGEKSEYNCEKWAFLLEAPFMTTAKCCDVMKKDPLTNMKSLLIVCQS